MKKLSVMLLLLMSIAHSLSAQIQPEARDAFYLEAIKNPHQIKAQVNALAQFKDHQDQEDKYNIYTSGAPIVNSRGIERQAILRDAQSLNMELATALYLHSMVAGNISAHEQSMSPEEIVNATKVLLLCERLIGQSVYQDPANVLFNQLTSAARIRQLTRSLVNEWQALEYFIAKLLFYFADDHYPPRGIPFPELPEHSALVSIGRYDQLSNPNAILGESAHYYALVWLPGKQQPKFVALGEGRPLSDEYEDYFNSHGLATSLDKSPGTRAYQIFWMPIARELENVKTVFLQPRGLYHPLALEGLPTSDQSFVGKGKRIIRINGIRELSARWDSGYYNTNHFDNPASFQLIGAPDFNALKTSAAASASLALNSAQDSLYNWALGKNSIPPQSLTSSVNPFELSTSADAQNELIVLNELFRKAQWTGEMYTGKSASIAALANIKDSPILHISTEGSLESNILSPSYKDLPHSRYLMFFAGANRYMPLLKKAKESKLTALELEKKARGSFADKVFNGYFDNPYDKFLQQSTGSVLNLLNAARQAHDIQLISLSIPGARSHDNYAGGSDVLELTNKFLFNDEVHILAPLWHIHEKVRSLFITRFYHHLLSGKSTRQALIQSQSDFQLSKDWSHPHYWAGWRLFLKD